MKNILFVIVILSFVGCKSSSYYQLYEFEPVNTKYDDHQFMIHENDSIKVTYSFWSNNGTVAFTFYNKLNEPIYIDWKKSSVIFNGKKENYWNDETVSSSTSMGRNITMTNPYNNPYLLFQNFGYSYNVASVYKPEPVSFIPPHSYIAISKFPINYSIEFNKNDLVLDNKEIICKREFNEKNSLVHLRNYISFSTNEKFENYINFDDVFYLKSVKEFPYSKDISGLAKPFMYYSKLKNKSINASKVLTSADLEAGGNVFFKIDNIVYEGKMLGGTKASDGRTLKTVSVEYQKNGQKLQANINADELISY
jgi:hypothetical protein